MKLAQKTWHVMALIMVVAIVEQFATDSYLPAFPAMVKAFFTNTSSIQLTLSMFLLGEALAQPFFGFLSDAYGRRPMFIMGVSIFCVASFAAWLAPWVWLLIIARVVQGFGVGSGIVLARSMAKDVFPSGVGFSKMVSVFSVILVLLQLISPVVGGYVQHHLGWHYIFLLIAILSIVLCFAIYSFLPETFPVEQRFEFKLHKLLSTYREVLVSKVFWLNLICASLASALTIIYVTITPFLYQHVLSVSVILFGWLTASIGFGAALGNFVNSQLVEKIGLNGMLKIGSALVSLAVLAMLVIGLSGILNVWVVLVPMLIAVIGNGFIGANASANALTPFPKLAGGAAAIYGGIQFLGFSLCSAGAALVHTKNQIPMASLMLVLTSIIFSIVYFFLPRAED